MPKKILIVDDDETLCAELGELLRDEGYSVYTSYNGIEAKDLILSNSYDVILLDLKLPGLSGFEILKQIRENNNDSRIIVLTGLGIAEEMLRGEPSKNEDEENCYNALNGADSIVLKPLDLPILLWMVRNVSRNEHAV